MPSASPQSLRQLLIFIAAVIGLLGPQAANAATDLANVPLASATTSSVKPNILFILDDSGSMGWDFMPDDVDSNYVGYRNFQCNTIYYNPNTNYVVPKDSTGVNLHNSAPATYTAACGNGYSTSSCSTNLGTKYYWQYLGPTADLSWPATGSNDCKLGYGVDITTKSGVCSNNTALSATTYPNPTNADCGGGNTLVWKRVTVTSASTDAQNYANWYSYYRLRIMMMKAASGRAFQSILDNYRVGFMTIHPGTFDDSGLSNGSSVSSSKFLKIDDFDSTHRSDWYSKLYATSTNSGTPLRSALSVAGRYYAGKNDLINDGMVPAEADDPVQYSCQQNFTILTTDGYWNSGNSRALNGSSQLTNQDGNLTELDDYNPSGSKFPVSPRPIYDGANTYYVWNTASNAYQNASCTTTVASAQQKTLQWQSRTVTLMKSTSQLQKRTLPLQARTSTVQSSTSTLLTSTATLQSETGTLVGTVSQVLMRCNNTTAVCGSAPATGIPNANWLVVTSCTSGSGTNSPRCARVSPSPTLTRNVVATCNTGATISASSPYSSSNTDGGYKYSSCSYTWTPPAPAGSCTYNVQTNFAGGTTIPTATRCSYSAWTTPTALGACTYRLQTTSTSNGTSYYATPKQCSYSSWSTPADAGACAVSARTTATTDGTVYNTAPMNCSYGAWSSWSDLPVATSCTPVSQSTSGTYNPIARQCQYGTWSGWSDVVAPSTNCTTLAQSSGAGTWANNPAVQCQYTAWSSPPVADNTCIAASASTSSPYTVLTAATCTPAYGTWTNTTGTCTASATLQCQTIDPGWVNVATPPGCTASGPNGSGQEVQCRTVNGIAGKKIQFKTTRTAVSYPGPSQTGSIISTNTSTDTSWSNLDGVCYPDGLQPSFPSTTVTNGVPTPSSRGLTSCSGGANEWPCEIYTTSGGSSNTLADVAQYYYKTDLRSSTLGNCTGALGMDVCDNNVPSSGTGTEDDKANWQHMTTFTMGLGLSGTLAFSPTYKSDTTGAFANLRAGNINWPVPAADNATAIDDLWHAAVNGRGQYFSARDPDSVVNSLQAALAGVSARVASAAAAATSNLEPVAGDNFAYTAKYVTQKWTGELEAHEIDLATGAVQGTAIWSAATKLAAKTNTACDNRSIKLFRSGASDNLVDFKWNTYACDGSGNPTGSAATGLNAMEQAHFTSSGTDTTGTAFDEIASLSQYPNMNATQKSNASGARFVNYLRGQRGNEGFDSGPPATNNDPEDNAKLFRTRDTVLGDIINAQPVFIKAPSAEYSNDTDPGYVTFRSSNSGRTPMVYVAANDGVLHAFHAGTSIVDTQGGEEAWAFMPSIVLPNLYKMASENYASQHTYSVDGTPTAGDVFDTTASADCALSTPTSPQSCWKTILVGGLNKGGQGYYALDVTDPANPKGLWEFKKSSTCIGVNATSKAPTTTAYADCHLGYSFNNPVIGKLSNGRWAVFVTSGYNNDDGIGYLYVLDAITGQILYRISTGVGDTSNPSGLNHIRGWVDNAMFDNTIKRIYGVDLLGHIWRFDVNDALGASGREATLVAQVLDDAGTPQPQPITTKPELAEVGGSPYVFVATGRYLGNTDIADEQTQTVWGIKDPLGTDPVTDLRTTLGERVIVNVGSGTSAYRVLTSTNCDVGSGWFADLPDSRERVNIDMKLQLGTLIVPSNVPTSNACNIGGYGWLNYFNYATGCAVSNSTNASVGMRLVGATGTESLAVGINIVRLPSGKTVVIATTSAAEQITLEAPFDTPPPVGKRVSWREVVQ